MTLPARTGMALHRSGSGGEDRSGSLATAVRTKTPRTRYRHRSAIPCGASGGDESCDSAPRVLGPTLEGALLGGAGSGLGAGPLHERYRTGRRRCRVGGRRLSLATGDQGHARSRKFPIALRV